jgi:hypothetical protein
MDAHEPLKRYPDEAQTESVRNVRSAMLREPAEVAIQLENPSTIAYVGKRKPVQRWRAVPGMTLPSSG